jgi:hypothetical protein
LTTVGCRLRHPAGASHAAGSAHVLDNHLLAQDVEETAITVT